MHLPGSMPGVVINAAINVAIKNLFKKLVWENIGHRRRYYMCGIAGFYQSHFDYLTKEEYPRRVYGDAVMPAGEYTSLRIVIGEGEGHNWWCVLFPTLCTGFSYSEEYIQTGFTPEEYRMITGGERFKVKLRILEVIEGLLG